MDASRWDADHITPQSKGLIVLVKHTHPDTLRLQSVDLMKPGAEIEATAYDEIPTKATLDVLSKKALLLVYITALHAWQAHG